MTDLTRTSDRNAPGMALATRPAQAIAAFEYAVSGATPSSTIAAIAAAGYTTMPETDAAAGIAVLKTEGVNWVSLRSAASSAAASTYAVRVFALHHRKNGGGIAAKYRGTINWTKGTAAVPEAAFGVANLVWADAAAVANGAFPESPGGPVLGGDLDNVPVEQYFDAMGAAAILLLIDAGATIEACGI